MAWNDDLKSFFNSIFSGNNSSNSPNNQPPPTQEMTDANLDDFVDSTWASRFVKF